MFASGYVPGQVAGLLTASNVKQKNVELAALFTSSQTKKKKKRLTKSTAFEASPKIHDDSVLPSGSDGSPAVEKKKKKKKSSGGEEALTTSEQLSPKKGKVKNVSSPQDKKGNQTEIDSEIVQSSLKKKKKKKQGQLSDIDTSPTNGKLKKSNELTVENGEESTKQDASPKKPKKKLAGDPEATVFVGNLPNTSDKKVLKKIFGKFGKIVSVRFRCATPADMKMPKKAAAIKKKFHEGRKNINAFVVFATKEQAQLATKANGVKVDGFTIRVDLLQGAKKHDHLRSVFVGNLPFNVEEELLREHFSDCGEIENVRVIRDSKSGLGKGFGYVLFKDKDGASFATQINGEVFQGRKLRIERSVEPQLVKEKSNKPEEVGPRKKKERHRLRMPTNASSKDYEGIRAQNNRKIKKKQKFKKKQRKFGKVENPSREKDGRTFKQPPKGKHAGTNARFRLSMKKGKS